MKLRTANEISIRWSDTCGAAYVEFLISFIPVFLMFLGMVQMSLMFVGGLAVQRAASAAARAAAVVLDDDPRYYRGEQRMTIEGTGGAGETDRMVLDFLADRGLSGDSGGGGGPPDVSSARLSAIRTAASIPLMSVAPTPGAIIQTPREESVAAAIGSTHSMLHMPASRAAFALLYNRAAMVVSFPDGPGSDRYETRWNGGQIAPIPTQARVRVTYLFHCAVPLANRLMCTDALYIAFGANASAAAAAARRVASGASPWEAAETFIRERDVLTERETRDAIPLEELRAQDATSWLGLAIGVSSLVGGPNPRFKVMSAEAQMPIHHANYRYTSE